MTDNASRLTPHASREAPDASRQIHFSFELFPPRTDETRARLPTTVAQMAALAPDYFSVTYGAGGSTRSGTYATVLSVASQTGIEVAPHLTCVGATREQVSSQLDRYRAAGIRRIVALRGDLPATSPAAAADGDFAYAADLVRFIRDSHGDHFRIEVAAYPEMHPQGGNPQRDFDHFRAKVEAGADCAITQYFFNADAYFDFLERCARARLDVPVIPGLMPITNHAQLTRFSAACGAEIPRWIRLRLEQLAEDRAALQDFGVEVVARLGRSLLDGGAPGVHLYTLNQAEPVLRLCAALGMQGRRANAAD